MEVLQYFLEISFTSWYFVPPEEVEEVKVEGTQITIMMWIILIMTKRRWIKIIK